MFIFLREDFFLDQSMDYTISIVIINFLWFDSYEINGYFYLMGLMWGTGKRNDEMQKYKQVSVLSFSPILVLSLMRQKLLVRNGEVGMKEQKTQWIYSHCWLSPATRH